LIEDRGQVQIPERREGLGETDAAAKIGDVELIEGVALTEEAKQNP
jgi:hypothetical protein